MSSLEEHSSEAGGTVRRRNRVRAAIPLTAAVARLTECGLRAEQVPKSPDSVDRSSLIGSPVALHPDHTKIEQISDEVRSKSSSLDSRTSREWVPDSISAAEEEEDDEEEHTSLPLCEQRLSHVIAEFICTERDYCSDLDQLITGYAEPLCSRTTISPALSYDEQQILFGNMSPLLELHRKLLSEMEACQCGSPLPRRHNQMCPSQAAEAIGRCLLNHCEQFSCYAKYCNNYPRAMKLLSTWSKNPTVCEYLDQQQSTLGHRLPLAAFLLKPVQRVLKYHLLLQSLLGCLPEDSPARPTVSEALASYTRVAHEVNELKRRHEHAVRAEEVTSVLVDWQGPQPSLWGDLVIENTFRVSGSKGSRHLLLFEKILLILKKRADGALMYKDHIMCSNLMLIESVQKEPLAFHVLPFDNPRSQHTVLARTPAQKRRWCQDLKRLIIENFDAEIPEGARKIVMETGAGVNAVHKPAAAPCAEAWESSPLADGGGRKHSIPEYLEKRKLRRKNSSPSLIPDRLRMSRRLSGPSILQPHQEADVSEGEDQSDDKSSNFDSKSNSTNQSAEASPIPTRLSRSASSASGSASSSGARLPAWPEDEDAGYATLEASARALDKSRQEKSKKDHCDGNAVHRRHTDPLLLNDSLTQYKLLPRLAPRAEPEVASVCSAADESSAPEDCSAPDDTEDVCVWVRGCNPAPSEARVTDPSIFETALNEGTGDVRVEHTPTNSPLRSSVCRRRSFTRDPRPQIQRFSMYNMRSDLYADNELPRSNSNPDHCRDNASDLASSTRNEKLAEDSSHSGGFSKFFGSIVTRIAKKRPESNGNRLSTQEELFSLLQKDWIGVKMAELTPSKDAGPYTLQRRPRKKQREKSKTLNKEKDGKVECKSQGAEGDKLNASEGKDKSEVCVDSMERVELRGGSSADGDLRPTWRDSSAVYEDVLIDTLEQLSAESEDEQDSNSHVAFPTTSLPVTAVCSNKARKRTTASADALLEQLRDSAFYSDGEDTGVPKLRQHRRARSLQEEPFQSLQTFRHVSQAESEVTAL